MAASKPIDISTLDEDTLAVARAAAQSAGMTLEDWLARTLGESAEDQPTDDSTQSPAAPDVDASADSGVRSPQPELDPDTTIVGSPPPPPSEAPAPPEPETAFGAGARGAFEPPRDSEPDGTQAAPSDAGPKDEGDLRAALHALAASLATRTANPAWAVRIDAIRRATMPSARTTAPGGAPTTQTMIAPRPQEPGPAMPRPDPAATETPAGDPALGNAWDVPPAPAARAATHEGPDQGEDDVFAEGELEKAIAAAQARRQQAGTEGGAPRRRRTAGGLVIRILIGLIAIASIALIALLAYVWLNPPTTVEEVVEDLSAEAGTLYDDAAAQINAWIGDDIAEEPPSAGSEPEAPPGDGTGTAPSPADQLPDQPSRSPVGDDGGAETAPADETPGPAAPPEPEGSSDAEPAADDSAASAADSELGRLQRRAEAGDPVAQRELGLRYLNGDDAPPDPEAAFLWLEEAAVGADAQAQYRLGTMLEAGTGTDRDPLIAMAWYMSSAEAGMPEANFRLGEIYRDGVLWPQSYADAAERFRAAADAGLPEAEFELARLYNTGDGVDRSPLLTHLWASRAAEAGVPGASDLAATVATTLTAEDLALSQRLSDNPPPTDSRLYGDAADASAVDATAARTDTEPVEAPSGWTAPEATPAPSGDTLEPATDAGPATGEEARASDTADVPAATTSTGLSTVVGADGTVTIDAAEDPDASEETDSQLPVSQISTAAIREIQTLLNALGYESGRPDGIPGPRTEQAIRSYQEEEGLQPTGQPSLSLLARLRSQSG